MTIDPKKVAKTIGMPLKRWPGNCFAIASQMVKHKIISGTAVYGHWLGPIAENSFFAPKAHLGFVQHGWVQRPDGSIVDPTRYVFEAVKPYVYEGPSDHYDEGGNRFRMAVLGAPPKFDPDEEQIEITKTDLPTPAWKHVERILKLDDAYYEGVEPGTVTRDQLIWLARVSPNLLMQHALAVYRCLYRHDLLAFVPLDNRLMVERIFGEKIDK